MDKRKLNCHKLRPSYVTSILITKLTFAMFLLKIEYIIRCYFSLCFISFVAFVGRRGGLMVGALDSGASGPGSSPGRGHCVVFLGKTLYSHGASLHPGV